MKKLLKVLLILALIIINDLFLVKGIRNHSILLCFLGGGMLGLVYARAFRRWVEK